MVAVQYGRNEQGSYSGSSYQGPASVRGYSGDSNYLNRRGEDEEGQTQRQPYKRSKLTNRDYELAESGLPKLLDIGSLPTIG